MPMKKSLKMKATPKMDIPPEQAGAELGQAQLKLGFDFNSISVELVR